VCIRGRYRLERYYLRCEAEGTELRIDLSLFGSRSGRLALDVTNRDAESFDFVADRDVVISAEFTGRKEKDCGVRLLTVEEFNQRVWDYAKEAARYTAVLWIHETYSDRIPEEQYWEHVHGLYEMVWERGYRREAEARIEATKRREIWAHTPPTGENMGGVVRFELPHKKCAITSIAIQVGTARHVLDLKELRKK